MAPIESWPDVEPEELTGRSFAPAFLRGPSSKTTWTDRVTGALAFVHVQPNVLSNVPEHRRAIDHVFGGFTDIRWNKSQVCGRVNTRSRLEHLKMTGRRQAQ